MILQSLFLFHSLFFFTLAQAPESVHWPPQERVGSTATQEKQSKVQPGFRKLPRDNEGLEKAQEGPDFLRRRQDWFFKPRAFPLGFIPQGARERALQQKIQMYQREGRLGQFGITKEPGFVTPPLGPTSAWFPIGPQPTATTLFDFS